MTEGPTAPRTGRGHALNGVRGRNGVHGPAQGVRGSRSA